ncbi:MAG: hypothetical protein K2W82_16260 [Candidatus Obscuribacterales bacterium]|nr:hypothetical protein [Candidatus Obscuribacterales bacterium]
MNKMLTALWFISLISLGWLAKASIVWAIFGDLFLSSRLFLGTAATVLLLVIWRLYKATPQVLQALRNPKR